MKKVGERTRKLGGTPVLVTSMERKGGLTGNASSWAIRRAVRDVAQEEACALIDLNAMSRVFYEPSANNAR